MNTQKNSASTFPYFGHKKDSIHRYLKAYHDPQIGPRISTNDKNEVLPTSTEDAKETVGALVCFTDETKEIIPSGTAVTGLLVGIAFRNHVYFTGNYKKNKNISNYIDLKILEEDKNNGELNKLPSIITFGIDSSFGCKLVGLLNAADLSKKIDFVLNTVLKGEKLGKSVASKGLAFPIIRKYKSPKEATAKTITPIWANGRLSLPQLPKFKSGRSSPDEGVISEINGIILDTVFEIHEKIIQNQPVEKANENQSDFTGRIKLTLKGKSEGESQSERQKS